MCKKDFFSESNDRKSISGFTFKRCSVQLKFIITSAAWQTIRFQLYNTTVLCPVSPPRTRKPEKPFLYKHSHTHSHTQGIMLHSLVSLFLPCNYTICRKHLFLVFVENQAVCTRHSGVEAHVLHFQFHSSEGSDMGHFLHFLFCCTCFWSWVKRLYHIWMR